MRLLIPIVAAMLLRAELKKEFIYESAPFPGCHASTLVETAPGEIYAAWFGGTDEGAKDVAIWGARRSNGVWSEPVELAREPNMPTWNPVLFITRDKTLWLYWKFGNNPRTWTGKRRFSRDAGRTWSDEEALPAGVLGPIRSKPFVLPDGSILAGSSVESDKAWAVWMERYDAKSRFVSKAGPIEFPGVPMGLIQPSIVRLPDGRLRAFMRSTPAIGKIVYSDSQDQGKTWNTPKATELPNPNSGVDAVTLADGRIALIYNHIGKGRSPLNVAISKDGWNFEESIALESEPGEFSYPALIQGQDGALHVTYTWNRKKIRYVRMSVSDLEPR
jgi:predicted neuraminidase